MRWRRNSEAEIHDKIGAAVGQDVTWHAFHVIEDQKRSLAEDVRKVTSHPLIPDSVKVGGFIYDVDTGLLSQEV